MIFLLKQVRVNVIRMPDHAHAVGENVKIDGGGGLRIFVCKDRNS